MTPDEKALLIALAEYHVEMLRARVRQARNSCDGPPDEEWESAALRHAAQTEALVVRIK